MAINMTELPGEVFDYIAELRKESARFRTQRNGARREADRLRESEADIRHELAGLRAERDEQNRRIASLMLDVFDLREGLPA